MLYARHWAIQIHFLTHVLHWHRHYSACLIALFFLVSSFMASLCSLFLFSTPILFSHPPLEQIIQLLATLFVSEFYFLKASVLFTLFCLWPKTNSILQKNIKSDFVLNLDWFSQNVQLVCLYKPALNQRNVGWRGGGLWKWSGRFHRRVESFVKKSATEDKRKKILVHKRCGCRTGKVNL